MVAGQSGNKKVVAIIPARGGSKRVPKKNIIDFNGKPMIAWTIEAAIKSNLFDRVIVSTDSEEIAEVSKKWGAEVPFLRDKYADDQSPVSEGTLATIRQLEKVGDYYDIVVQLLAVCPLRDQKDIIQAFDFFTLKKAPFVISCYKYVWMNPWWAVTLDKTNKPEWVFKDIMKRSQDLPELFSPTGAIWIADIKNLKSENSFYGRGHIFWKMDWKNAIDIDNYEDIELAKALLKIRN